MADVIIISSDEDNEVEESSLKRKNLQTNPLHRTKKPKFEFPKSNKVISDDNVDDCVKIIDVKAAEPKRIRVTNLIVKKFETKTGKLEVGKSDDQRINIRYTIQTSRPDKGGKKEDLDSAEKRLKDEIHKSKEQSIIDSKKATESNGKNSNKIETNKTQQVLEKEVLKVPKSSPVCTSQNVAGPSSKSKPYEDSTFSSSKLNSSLITSSTTLKVIKSPAAVNQISSQSAAASVMKSSDSSKPNVATSTPIVNNPTKTIKRIQPISLSTQLINDESKSSGSPDDLDAIQPMLIVKRREPVVLEEHQTAFGKFLDLCRRKESGDTMEKVLSKLQKKYDKLDKASKDEMTEVLLAKVVEISRRESKVYLHIQAVMETIKAYLSKSIKMENKTNVESSTNNNKSKTQEMNGEEKERNDDEGSIIKGDNENRNMENENRQLTPEERQRRRDIRKILKTMRRCEKKIKILEMEEVDFDDDKNSAFMQWERYKQRQVELWNEYCKYSGESTDAGRQYLKPKYLTATRIAQVDKAIASFVNSKISQRNELAKKGRLADVVVFPDYQDILNCINVCNTKENLRLDEKTEKKIAENAFKEVGSYLQRMRKEDYWDTFSLYLESNEEDPACSDEVLANKLKLNKVQGDKKLNEVFEEYVRKQEGLSTDELEKEMNIEENEEDEEIEGDDNDVEANKNEVEIEIINDDDDTKNTVEEPAISKATPAVTETNENNENQDSKSLDESTSTLASLSPKTNLLSAKSNNCVSSTSSPNKQISKATPATSTESKISEKTTSFVNEEVVDKAGDEEVNDKVANENNKSTTTETKACEVSSKTTDEVKAVDEIVEKDVQKPTENVVSEIIKPVLRVRSFAKYESPTKDDNVTNSVPKNVVARNVNFSSVPSSSDVNKTTTNNATNKSSNGIATKAAVVSDSRIVSSNNNNNKQQLPMVRIPMTRPGANIANVGAKLPVPVLRNKNRAIIYSSETEPIGNIVICENVNATPTTAKIMDNCTTSVVKDGGLL